MNPALAVENLSYRYAKAPVWEQVSFTLDPGTVAYLIGPNGSGKSTLLRCLAGWANPSSGTIKLLGKPFDGRDRKQRADLAFVPDVPVFYDDLTAAEHVQFVLGAARLPSLSKHADRLFEAFGLEAFRDQLPATFSRGMKEKLGLLIALALEPRVLLLDEPHGPLDQQAAHALSKEIMAAADEGTAVLISCHHKVPQLKPDKVLRFAEGGFTQTHDVPDDIFPSTCEDAVFLSEIER